MSGAPPPRTIPGRAILREVRNAYQDAYAATLRDRGTRVLVVRFEATTDDPVWTARMEAARVSADQKIRLFSTLGAEPTHHVLPDTVGIGEMADIVHAANADPQVAGIIVQSPPPQPVLALLNEIAPGKDIDSLGLFAPRTTCATADGIVRVAEPYLPGATIAVVGSNGFVGSGVVSQLRQNGHEPMVVEAGDDLRVIREADVVLTATGVPGLLTTEHVHAGHRLVVDSGFYPAASGPLGDLHPAAAELPQLVTPVPGGIGPVEMAVLAERLVQQEAASGLASWHFHGLDQDQMALTSAHDDIAELQPRQQQEIDPLQREIEPYEQGYDLDDGLDLS